MIGGASRKQRRRSAIPKEQAPVTRVEIGLGDRDQDDRRGRRVGRAPPRATDAGGLACFSANGYYSTTIRDVAEHANVSIGLIYQYVGDKEDPGLAGSP